MSELSLPRPYMYMWVRVALSGIWTYLSRIPMLHSPYFFALSMQEMTPENMAVLPPLLGSSLCQLGWLAYVHKHHNYALFYCGASIATCTFSKRIIEY